MDNTMLPRPHRILKVIRETKAEYTFRVEYSGSSLHGQFFMLSIPKVGEAPISVSGRGDGFVEFTIRKIGRLTEGIFGLNEGDNLFMRGPYGNCFPLEKFEGKDLAVICGGTGMAPVRTMLRHFAENPEKCRSLHLITGFKDADSVLFSDELEQFRRSFHTVCCLDNSEAEGFRRGFVTEYIDEIPFKSFEDFNVVIVGPSVMMSAAAKKCMALGVPPEKIWVSFERKMSCAVGKCGHCKINETYVCLEGPVFNYTVAKGLFD